MLYLILFFISFSFGGLIQPDDGKLLNYTHVLFEWEQEPDADAYLIEISSDSEFINPEISQTDSSLIYIEKEMINWQTAYFWRVAPIYEYENSGEWIGTRTFSTGTAISNAEATIYNENLYSDGLTLFGAFYDYYSAIIDMNGNEIWNTGNLPFIFYNTDYYGQFYGCEYVSGQPNGYFYKGVKFSLDNEIIWDEPNDEFNHHEIIELPNGNFLGIIEVEQLGPVPTGEWSPLCFNFYGHEFCNGINENFTWFGDKIIEWDKETKEVVWEWNFFDYLSMEDYDIENGTWFDAFVGSPPQRYDWTHANALWFDELESAVYVSIRHLSRIVKIDYPSGEIIWSMGEDMPSGDVDFGTDLGFNFQHSLQISDEGTILIFDNGNSDFQSRALEIQVTEQQNEYSAQIIWEYNLSSELYSSFSGNVQKINSGNYLITSIGESGTTLEISPNQDLVWEGKYNLSEPLGAVYRANRISGLYPIAFNTEFENLIVYDNEPVVLLPIGNSPLNITINNDGDKSDTINYTLVGDGEWFSSQSGSIFIESGKSHELSFVGNTSLDSNPHTIVFSISPVHRPDLAQSKEVKVIATQQQSLDSNEISKHFILNELYPNPFNSEVLIDFFLFNSNDVLIDIYNHLGEKIENFTYSHLNLGKHRLKWNADDVSAGIYFIRVKTAEKIITKKVTVLK